MGDRGNTSVPLTAQTTEWDDILINKGILSRDEVLRIKGVDPEDVRRQEALEALKEAQYEALRNETLENRLERTSLEDLNEMEDEFNDEEEDAILRRIREKRLEELKAKKACERFGEVQEISKAEWVTEVNDASQSAWVVIHLYENSKIECSITDEALRILATTFKNVKFLRIRSSQAVENWPESKLPALFIYHEGKLKFQVIGVADMGGVRMRPEDLEWRLAKLGVVETELEEDPRSGVGLNAINVNRSGQSAAYDSDSDG